MDREPIDVAALLGINSGAIRHHCCDVLLVDETRGRGRQSHDHGRAATRCFAAVRGASACISTDVAVPRRSLSAGSPVVHSDQSGTAHARTSRMIELWRLLTFWIFAAILSGRLIVKGS